MSKCLFGVKVFKSIVILLHINSFVKGHSINICISSSISTFEILCIFITLSFLNNCQKITNLSSAADTNKPFDN